MIGLRHVKVRGFVLVVPVEAGGKIMRLDSCANQVKDTGCL